MLGMAANIFKTNIRLKRLYWAYRLKVYKPFLGELNVSGGYIE